MNMFFVAIIFVFHSRLSYVNSDDCTYVYGVGKFCVEKFFDPADLIHGSTYRAIDINFLKMKGNISLTIPEEFLRKKYDNAIYKTFNIENSCVKDIQENFFSNLDKSNNALEKIAFKNVLCLRKLSTKSFRGIGSFVKILEFESMIDLLEIEEDFFDSLNVLKTMTIIKTGIRVLSQHIFMKMPKIEALNVSCNHLSSLPQIPKDRKDLIDKIFAYNNPFDCQCSLEPFVKSMKKVLTSELYKCSTPINLKGQGLNDVDLCGSNSITIKTNQKKEKIATAKIRIEIIIAASLIVLIIVVVIIIVVLYKRYIKSKKDEFVYEQRSPSKIVFQNESEPFIYKYDEKGTMDKKC